MLGLRCPEFSYTEKSIMVLPSFFPQLFSQSFFVCLFTLFLKTLSSVVENLPANAEAPGDTGSIPELGRCPGGGNGNSLQGSCLENPVDRRVWRATVHGATESDAAEHTQAYLLCGICCTAKWISQAFAHIPVFGLPSHVAHHRALARVSVHTAGSHRSPILSSDSVYVLMSVSQFTHSGLPQL